MKGVKKQRSSILTLFDEYIIREVVPSIPPTGAPNSNNAFSFGWSAFHSDMYCLCNQKLCNTSCAEVLAEGMGRYL